MSNVGGSANINGILFQILGTLDNAMGTRIEGAKAAGGDILEARLIVEPAGGGGDLQVVTVDQRRVQQWKAKANGGTWSLKSIIEEVLPDLYMAVPNEGFDIGSSYEFVTEGRIGNWQESYKFFQSLPNQSQADQMVTSLADSPTRHKVGKTSRLSDRGLFLQIVNAIRQRIGNDAEPEALTIRKTWHLLRRFSFLESTALERLVNSINNILAQYVEIAEEVDNKRRELCGLILEVASEGDRVITAEWLLRNAKIPVYSFREWKRLQRRMADRLMEQLAKEKYDPNLDVRSSPILNPGVTTLSGESGQGKTWQLARAAIEATKLDKLVVWVPSSRIDSLIAQYAANEITGYGLEWDAQITLQRVAARFEQSRASATKPWALICVDEVRSTKEAESLLNLDWDRWGISLAITLSPEIARSLALRGDHPFQTANDFSTSELQDYLERHKIPWEQISHDLFALIRRPILAKIYSDIAVGNREFNPQTEYDLLEAAWNRISAAADSSLLRGLAGSIQRNESIYPWAREYIVRHHGGSAESIERLIGHGWLRDVGDGKIALWHNRFLNWALAKFLVNEFHTKMLSQESLEEFLQQCSRHDSPNRIALGYVPMDVLWLLLDPAMSASHSTLWRLLAAIEYHAGMSFEDEFLYRNVVPSLGSRVVSVLVDRVRHSTEDAVAIPTLVSDALILIGRHKPQAVSEVTRKCIADSQPSVIELGLRLTSAYPGSVDPERAWQIYRSIVTREHKDGVGYSLQQRGAQSFNKVAGQNLNWLRAKLVADSEDEQSIAALLFALARLSENSAAREIWLETKQQLFGHVRQDRRSLAWCIAAFQDTDEYARLEEWSAESDHSTAAASLQALSYRSPARAIKVLANVRANLLAQLSSSVGRAILAANPTDTCKELERLASARPEDSRFYIQFLSNSGDCLTALAATLVLNWLTTELEKSIVNTDQTLDARAHMAIRSVNSMVGSTIVDALQERHSTRLADLLFRLAKSRIPLISQFSDQLFDQAFKLLQRMAGTAFTALINAMLQAEHRQIRMLGCESAIISSNLETVELLKTSVSNDVLWDSNGQGINLIQMRALDALSAIGQNSAVVSGILKWGKRISRDLNALGKKHHPMSDEDLKPATSLLERRDSEALVNAVIAIGNSGRTEYLDTIETIFSKAPHDSELSLACMLAMGNLATNCERSLGRLIEQYQTGHHKFAAVRVLEQCDTSYDTYLRILKPKGPYDDLDQQVIKYLGSKEESRREAKSLIREFLSSARLPVQETIGLLDPNDSSDLDMLLETSVLPDTGLHFSGSKALALKGLGAAVPDVAFRLGLHSLRVDRRDRDRIPQVLMHINSGKAVAELCGLIRRCSDKVVCFAIGRAFRENAENVDIVRPILGLLSDADWRARRAGAFLTAFLDSPELVATLEKQAFTDPVWDVCVEAQHSLRARHREVEAMQLVNKLQSKSSSKMWGVIDCIVQLADPVILLLPNDPIGFRREIQRQPYALQRFALQATKKRREEIEKDLSSVFNQWDVD